MEKIKNTGILILIFGAATLLASFVNNLALLIPLRTDSPQWIYSTAGSISETCIIPLIGLLALITGFYLSVSENSKAVLLFERITAGICATIALFLLISTLMFSLSVSQVENNMVNQVKVKGENLKKQVTAYAQGNSEVSAEQLNQSISNIDDTLLIQVRELNSNFLKTNVKILINNFAYITAYSLFGIILCLASLKTAKNLKPEV